MVHLHFSVGGDALQIYKVAVNKLNKLSQTADKGWSFNMLHNMSID